MKFYLKLTFCIGWFVTYGWLLWLRPFWWLTFMLGIPVCVWLACWCHELGHLFAYRLWKLVWKRMAVGWFVLKRGKGLHLDRHRPLWQAGCTCAYDPDIPVWRYGIALLSGGLCTLLLCIGAMTAVYFTSGGIKAFLLCFGGICGVNAGWNLLLPMSADRILLRQIKDEREKIV